ncbi:hypothetical protein EDB81DRAFT_311343 [Dactylonectria macrodidyma]|uniref:Uncharacterized protein n=1 Tax=Dactylonectria macrodidyma TaxID=307937 RepID=A0A9P9D4P8_9HYPO|nr:hypothetical protein EDB81DRAFT_311343 [Dactylonectria macrodidyma]
MDVAALTEELTIQKVILDSLQYETFEGVEEERFEIRQEIDRLKKLLRITKPWDGADEPTLPPALPTRPRANQTLAGPSPGTMMISTRISLPNKSKPRKHASRRKKTMSWLACFLARPPQSQAHPPCQPKPMLSLD